MKKLMHSFIYAFRGVRFASRERNFRIQLSIACVVVLAGFYVELTTSEWLIIILTIGLVLSLETLNTAVEHLVNLAMPQYHPLAGKIKDLSAGAVLIVSIVSVIIAMIIFLKYLL